VADLEKRIFLIVISVAFTLGAGIAKASCGASFCSVNTNWDVLGMAAEPGLRMDLRFEYIDQDQPRSGSDKVAVGEIPQHHDEIRTLNRNLLVGFDYSFDNGRAISIQVPFVHRTHDHIHNHQGEQLPEHWDFSAVGDARVLGRYQFFSGDSGLSVAGMRLGLKLPTGGFHQTNDDGEEAERSLQPGTGTTDLLIGTYYNRTLTEGIWSNWFVQALWQIPTNERAGFRPGQQFSLDAGLRHDFASKASALVQINTHIKGRDTGPEAENDTTGGTFISLSPGVSYAFTRYTSLYGFVQKPFYQHVNGVQLTADWSAAVGVTHMFK
jgi:hypothetical protein